MTEHSAWWAKRPLCAPNTKKSNTDLEILSWALHLRHSSTELALVPVGDAIGAADGGVLHGAGDVVTTARLQETSTVDLKQSQNSIWISAVQCKRPFFPELQGASSVADEILPVGTASVFVLSWVSSCHLGDFPPECHHEGSLPKTPHTAAISVARCLHRSKMELHSAHCSCNYSEPIEMGGVVLCEIAQPECFFTLSLSKLKIDSLCHFMVTPYIDTDFNLTSW